MKTCPLILILLCLLACTDRKAEPKPTILPMPRETFTCSESIDLEDAKISIIKRIYEVCSSNYENYAKQEGSKGTINLDTTYITSTYACETDIPLYSALVKPVDTLIKDGEIASITFCIKNSDAAKPYIDKQRILAEKMEKVLAAANSDAWLQIQNLWNDFMSLQIRLEGLGVESNYYASAKKSYEDAIEDYKGGCSAKLHWNPDRKNPYSDIVFSKLSGSVKMEKSPCKGKGISLAYKDIGPECSSQYGVNDCSYKLSLIVRSCNGTEHRQLKNDVAGAHQKKDFALEELQENLKSAEFWDEWIEEIKQWSPQKCE